MKEVDLEEPPDRTDAIRQRGHRFEGLVGIQIIIPTYANEMRTNCRKKVEPKMGQRKRDINYSKMTPKIGRTKPEGSVMRIRTRGKKTGHAWEIRGEAYKNTSEKTKNEASNH